MREVLLVSTALYVYGNLLNNNKEWLVFSVKRFHLISVVIAKDDQRSIYLFSCYRLCLESFVDRCSFINQGVLIYLLKTATRSAWFAVDRRKNVESRACSVWDVRQAVIDGHLRWSCSGESTEIAKIFCLY